MAATRSKEVEKPSRLINQAGVVDEKLFRVNTKCMRELITRTLEVDRDSDGEESWSPQPAIVEKVWEHFRKKPFDRIRLGILKIESKTGLKWFEPNDEQLTVLGHLEFCWKKQTPARISCLKARQVGMSTLSQAVLYSLMCVMEYTKSHLVADLIDKCENITDMWRTYHEHDAWWMRPEITQKSNPIKLEGKYMAKSQCLFESAERREKTGRSFTAQFNHWSEIDWWPEDMVSEIVSSLLKCVPDEGFTVIIEESTGRFIESTFYKRFMASTNNELGDYKGFFFPWFTHKEYRIPLNRGMARGLTPKEFFETLNTQDQEMWATYNLDAEQVNWYVWKRQEEMLGDSSTLDMFRREYPCTIEEAFLGSNSNFFEPNLLKQDAVRLGQKSGRKIVPLEEVTKVCNPLLDDGFPKHYARCSLDSDEMNMCRNPRLVDDKMGNVRVYEQPRHNTPYVVTADSARGEFKQKNVAKSQDWDVIDVWRVGYIEGTDAPQFTQVCQLRGQGIGPRRLAQAMVALAEIYRDTGNYRKALMVPENNSHGLALIEEAKDLGAGPRMYQKVSQGGVNDPVQRTYGYNTTGGSAGKWALMTAFRQAYERNLLHHMAEISVLEMQTFANRQGKLEAVPPNHDDTVITGALMVEGVRFGWNTQSPVKIETEVITLDDGESPEVEHKKINVAKRRAKMNGQPVDEELDFDYESAMEYV